MTLTPTFDSEVTEYEATTSNASNTITATPCHEEAEITLKVDGEPAENGEPITWEGESQTVTITVELDGEKPTVYTIEVSIDA